MPDYRKQLGGKTMKTSLVARFIASCIEKSHYSQKEIAMLSGFERPNIITMIKQGKTKVPLDKIGLIANALEIDALQLFKMCMEEYQPSTWDVIAPFMEPTLTRDETRLLMALRESTGGLSLSALGDKSRQHLEDFILSVSVPLPVVQTEARSDSR